MLHATTMGIWFFTFSLANLLAGLVARFSKRLEAGEVSFVLEGLPGFYLMLVVFPMGAAARLSGLVTTWKPRARARSSTLREPSST